MDDFDNRINCDECKHSMIDANEKPCNSCVKYDDRGEMIHDHYEPAKDVRLNLKSYVAMLTLAGAIDVLYHAFKDGWQFKLIVIETATSPLYEVRIMRHVLGRRIPDKIIVTGGRTEHEAYTAALEALLYHMSNGS